jgi:hypothetical protein
MFEAPFIQTGNGFVRERERAACRVFDMFDVYLNDRRELLVVPKGSPIPAKQNPSRWRKKKYGVAAVSDEIKLAVSTRGFYRRKLKDIQR